MVLITAGKGTKAAVTGSLAIALVWLTSEVMYPPPGGIATRLDLAFLELAQGLQGPFSDVFFRLATWFGSFYLLAPLTVFLGVFLMRAGWRREAGFLLAALLGASLLAHMVKLLVARPRPFALHALVATPADWSFPSGHTAQITAFLVALLLIRKRALPGVFALSSMLVGCALALTVGFSRIYLQVHYFSDVVGGVLLAVLWVLSLDWIMKSRWPAPRRR